jgi:hypothetical protein
MGWTAPKDQSHPRTSEYGLVWRWGLSRCNQIMMKSQVVFESMWLMSLCQRGLFIDTAMLRGKTVWRDKQENTVGRWRQRSGVAFTSWGLSKVTCGPPEGRERLEQSLPCHWGQGVTRWIIFLWSSIIPTDGGWELWFIWLEEWCLVPEGMRAAHSNPYSMEENTQAKRYPGTGLLASVPWWDKELIAQGFLEKSCYKVKEKKRLN